MAMRSIVCLFDGMDQEYSALETAIGLAKSEAAHLKVVHTPSPIPPVSGPVSGFGMFDREVMEAIKASRERSNEFARNATAELCKRHQVPLDGNGCSLPRVTFLSIEANDGMLLRTISLCDLVVVGAGLDDLWSGASTNAALFNSGRPVLIVRPAASDGPARLSGGRCAIAWNGTPEATRALINARPLIEVAREVHIIVTDDTSPGDPARLPDAARGYLAAYGIEARLDLVEVGHQPPAEAVLQRVRELECDTLVMGAYGHSVFREMVLGGFSEYMLRNCEIPLIVCH